MTSIVTRLRSLPSTDFNGLSAISAVQDAADIIEALTAALAEMPVYLSYIDAISRGTTHGYENDMKAIQHHVSSLRAALALAKTHKGE